MFITIINFIVNFSFLWHGSRNINAILNTSSNASYGKKILVEVTKSKDGFIVFQLDFLFN